MTNPLITFKLWYSRHRRARLELAKRLRIIFHQELSYVLGGTHDWQYTQYDHMLMPPIDVVCQGLYFSFLPPNGGAFGPLLPRRRILEEAFRRRLRFGNDVVPVLPLFVNPIQILRLKDESLFMSYLDECWHASIVWGLRQLPQIPGDQESSSPGTADSRRAYLEEATLAPFFTSPNI